MPSHPVIRLRHLRTLEAAPLLLAQRRGLFAQHGIEVELEAADGWSMAKNLLISGRIDAAHLPMPLPLACALGIDGRQTDLRIALQMCPAGGALIFGQGLRGGQGPEALRGRRVGVPHRHSMSHYLLAQWLAAGGVNPLEALEIVETAPSRMRAHLREGRVDAVFAQSPFAQQILRERGGSLAARTFDIWPQYPGDVLAVRQTFHTENPDLHRALVSAVADGARALHGMREETSLAFARELAPRLHHIDEDLIAKALRSMPRRLPAAPNPEHLVWLVAQMQRWGQLRGDIDHWEFAERMCLREEARTILGADRETGIPPSFQMVGDVIDPRRIGDALGRLSFSVHHPGEEPSDRLYLEPEAIHRRLDTIIDAMAEVGAGELHHRLAITSSGPVGLLEQAFNEMVANLEVTREELDELRATLERRVAERTQELREANQMLERLLHQDVLTGLHNRRHFTEAIRREFKRAKRHDLPLTIVMVDLDHFKSVNDTHGHQTGDDVLVRVADVMQACARTTDIVARHGGEEFCAVLPHTPLDGGQQFAERLRTEIASIAMPTEDGELRITASFGVATLTEGMESEETLVRAADDALYHAKEAGRNRVCTAA